MKTGYLELTIPRGSSYIEEFQLIDENGIPIPLTNTEMVLIVKESENTDVELINTVLPVMDNDLGMFKINLTPIQSNLFDFPYGHFWIYYRTTAPLAYQYIPYVAGPLVISQGAN